MHDTPLPEDLGSWSRAIGSPSGDVSLLGTGLRAATYPGLLWNGARLHRAGAPPVDGLVVVAMAAGGEQAGADDLGRGVGAGLRVGSAVAAVGGYDGTARPTTGVVAAAACAAVVMGTDPDDLGAVLDLAGSLMVVTAPVGADHVQRGLWAGHCLAAGWLASQVRTAGLVTMRGALAHTVGVVTGHDTHALEDLA